MAEWNGIELDGLVLHGGRLTLRPWQASDAPAVQSVMADQRMSAYLPLPTPYTAQDAVEFVTEGAMVGRTRGSSLDCAVAENAGGQLVGSASLHFPVAGRASAEIGYWIASEHWGRGYATEATSTLARFGFSAGLSRVQIQCDPRNIASARVALRAGFSYEGVLRAAVSGPDGPCDSALFARLAGDSGTEVSPASWPGLATLTSRTARTSGTAGASGTAGPSGTARPSGTAGGNPLTDGVVWLRPVTAGDWKTLLAEMNNELSRTWGFGGEPLTEAAARVLADRAGLAWLTGHHLTLLICDAATGAGAGILTLRGGGPPDVLGIGYGVLPEFRGQHFTTRALNLVADWLFSQSSVARLELGCKVANVASARSAEAAGFARDALFQARLRNPDGSFSDEIGYARVRPGLR